MTHRPTPDLPCLDEADLHAILEQIPAFAAVLALDGTLLRATRAPLAPASIAACDAVGKKLWECDCWSGLPEVWERLREAVERAAGGAPQRFDVAVRAADLSTAWLDLQIAPMPDAAGQVISLGLSAIDIGERKKAEVALRQRADELEQLLETVPAAVWVTRDPQCLEIRGNHRANQIYEADRGENVSATAVPEARRFLAPDGRELTADELPMQLATAENRPVRDAELSVVLSSGRRYALLGNAEPLRDERGEVRGCIGAFIDVTERRDAEQALRESEARLRTLVDGLPLLVWVHGPDGRLEMVNRAFCEFFGITEEEARDSIWQTLLHPEDGPAYVAEFFDCVGAQRPFHAQARVRRADGTWRWIESWARPRFSDTDTFLGFVGSSADVTERQAAEEALRVARDSFYYLVKQSPFGVYAVDADFRLVDVSVGAQQVFENIDPLIGRDFAEVLRLIWTEPFASEAIALFRRTLETGEPYHSPSTVARREDNSAVEAYDWKIERVTLPDGRFGVVCHFYDLSERRRYEAALQEADRRKDAFLATLAHELRNPLAPLKTGLEILRMCGGDPDAAGRAHAMMERQLNHLVRLVDDLLDVSRITRGTIELRREDIDLADAVRAAIETIDPSRADGGRRLEASLPSEPLQVHGDPVRLAQAIANLLSNAVKFTGAGGLIRITLAAVGDQARISVTDDGEGIPPEHLERIFEMFSQTRPGRGGGMGIGLSLARALVGLHGGRVEAYSAGLGRGSELRVYLPLVETRRTPKQPAAAADDPRIARRRILVVDDNPDIADSLGMLLRALGADVQVAYGAAEALESFGTYKPEVVLMDIGMPDMDGCEVARRMRERRPDPDLLLVAITGWGGKRDRRRIELAGFDHHIVKPASIQQLRAVLASADRPAGFACPPGS
jgi:PAS domain S-box-containing protein